MQSKMFFREIRSSLGRYLAIAAIIALGVGFFSGLRVSRDAMLQTCNTYLDEQNLYDYRLLSTWGFEDGDAEAFLALDCVDAAAGAISQDFLTELHGNEVVLRAHSLTQNINIASLVAGRMPEHPDECVADANLFSEDAIGSQLVIADNNDAETQDAFAYGHYTIVGIIDSPTYLNFERGTTSLGSGSLSGFVYLLRAGFDSEYDTELYLSLTASAEIYSDEYQQYVEESEPQIRQVLDEIALRRYNRIYDEAADQITEGEAELADGRAEYLQQKADTQRELDDARQQLEEAQQQLVDARTELDSRYAQLEQLEQAEQQYREYSQLLATLRTQLAEGEAAYKENYAAYEAGLAEYEQGAAEAQEQFAAAETRLAQSEQLLLDSSGELAAARAQLDEGYAQADRLEALGLILQAKLLRAQLSAAEEQYQEGMQALLNGQAEYNVAYAAYQQQKAEAEQQLDAAKAELDDAAAQLAQGRETLDGYAGQEAELSAAVEQLAQYAALAGTMRTALADAEAELADGQSLYEENYAAYLDGVQEAETAFTDAEQELLDAEAELTDARDALADLERPSTYALDRSTNIGYVCFESDTNIVNGVAKVFPLFFFLVAALICITTMTRMIDDERTQIGVLKALGYSEHSIMGKYLAYSCSASLLGCLIGFFLGSWTIPKVIWLAYGIMYSFPGGIELLLDWKLAAFCIAAYILCVVLATWSSCKSTLQSDAASLIRPQSPKAGKRILLERIGFLWKHMKFLYKVSIRNIFRYKKRLVMMILGIGGCTALVLTGYGIRDSVEGLASSQYTEITCYDFSVTLTEEATDSVRADIEARLGDGVQEAIYLSTSSVDVTAGSVTKASSFIVSDAQITDFNHFTDGKHELPYPGVGEALIDESLADFLDVKAGDRITVRDSDMRELTLTVSGLYQNHISHFIYVSPETCEQQWGFVPEYKTAYFQCADDADVHAIAAAVSNSSYASAVTVTADSQARITAMMAALDYIVWMVIICAGALALIVLYNLTNINITERIREIATIKVLGFQAGETASYVFRENIMLTVFGALFGLPLGKLLHWYVMQQIRLDFVNFNVKIEPVSYFIAIGFTFLFTVLVNFIMYFRLQRISMAESLKSIE